jgi:hypothetical protein
MVPPPRLLIGYLPFHIPLPITCPGRFPRAATPMYLNPLAAAFTGRTCPPRRCMFAASCALHTSASTPACPACRCAVRTRPGLA